jgi:hypothetical protein
MGSRHAYLNLRQLDGLSAAPALKAAIVAQERQGVITLAVVAALDEEDEDLVVFPGEESPALVAAPQCLARLAQALVEARCGELTATMRMSEAESVATPRAFGLLPPGARAGALGTLVECTGFSVLPRQTPTQVAPPVSLMCVGRARVELVEALEATREGPFLLARVRLVLDDAPFAATPAMRANATSLPRFLVAQADPVRLAQRALALSEKLLVPFEGGAGVLDADHAVQLSYAMARNLPAGAAQRRRLLETRNVSERLVLIIELLRRTSQVLRCHCGSVVAHTDHFRSMANSAGLVGVYVNPHGAVHQILTVTVVRHCFLDGDAETEHSYFAGYSWTCMGCRACGGHLGWRFAAVHQGLDPPVFFGLLRDGLDANRVERDDADSDG